MAFWCLQEVGSERADASATFWYDVAYDAKGIHSACPFTNYLFAC